MSTRRRLLRVHEHVFSCHHATPPHVDTPRPPKCVQLRSVEWFELFLFFLVLYFIFYILLLHGFSHDESSHMYRVRQCDEMMEDEVEQIFRNLIQIS